MAQNEAVWNFDDVDDLQLRSGNSSAVVSPGGSDEALNLSMNEALAQTPGLAMS